MYSTRYQGTKQEHLTITVNDYLKLPNNGRFDPVLETEVGRFSVVNDLRLAKLVMGEKIVKDHYAATDEFHIGGRMAPVLILARAKTCKRPIQRWPVL